MSGVWLPASSIIISLFLVVIFFLKENVHNEEVKVYKKLIIYNFLFSLNATIVYIFSKIVGNVFIIGLMQKIHLSLLVVIGYYLCLYLSKINGYNKKNSKCIIERILLLIVFIGVFGTVISPVEVINYDEILDVGGISYYFSISSVIIYFIFMIVLSIKYHLQVERNIDKIVPILSLIVMFVIGFLLRIYFPEVITETFCTTFALLIMYFTIENPDVKMISQLSLAKDAAEKANRAKSDFLSSMSHEIRTPLNAIVGLSQDIINYDIPEEALEDANDIINASNTLLEIVGNILDINKIESEKMEIVNKPYNFREEVGSLIRVTSTRIGDKPIEFSYNIAEDIPGELIGDKVHVKAIVNNLLTNAIKYTDSGKITVNIKCINENDMCNLFISVQDTGRGIKAEDINKLFNKFERLDIEKNSTTEGTGLGLAITKRLVEMMGGKINVQSTYREGSLFVVTIPQKISRREVLTNTQILNTRKVLASLREEYKGKKILIVDDNKLNIKVAKKALEDFNFFIDEAYDGEECIKKVKNGNIYDLILMDIMMPKMSGRTALQELKKLDNFNTPVIALTADALADSENKYINDGFVDYIAKPFNKEQIAEKLDKIFIEQK